MYSNMLVAWTHTCWSSSWCIKSEGGVTVVSVEGGAIGVGCCLFMGGIIGTGTLESGAEIGFGTLRAGCTDLEN